MTAYSQKDFDYLLANTIENVKELSLVKGAEYAPNDDRLENFRRVARTLNLPMEVVWQVYAAKHWDAIQTYIADILHRRSRYRSEPIYGRVEDLIVYLILLKAMIQEREDA
jgi:hypothetical protein